MYRDIATTLYKRGEASMDGYEMPSWAWAVFALNIVVFLPLFLIVGIHSVLNNPYRIGWLTLWV
jgi:hypothetical protein